MIILDNELKHYGVKGMRWGVRKKRYTTIQEGPQEQNGKKKKSSKGKKDSKKKPTSKKRR